MAAGRAGYPITGCLLSPRSPSASPRPHSGCPGADPAPAHSEVHRIDDIAGSTADDLEKKCREVYFNSRFGVIARPDSLERGDGLARTFKQVERSTIDQWHLLAPMLQEVSSCVILYPDSRKLTRSLNSQRDVEATSGRRRYLAIQSAPQQGRRPRGKVEVVPTIDSGDSPPPSDRSMTGFMLVEHDLVHGTLLFAAALPWVLSGSPLPFTPPRFETDPIILSGPSFDASTELGGLAVQRAKADLYHTNREREALGLAPFPPIKYLWLLSPFHSDSKWAKSLALRNYRLASEVAQEEPNFPFEAFPPHREVFVPAQCASPVPSPRVWVLELTRYLDIQSCGASSCSCASSRATTTLEGSLRRRERSERSGEERPEAPQSTPRAVPVLL